ncbi:MAG TPA: hypothetical protein PK640_16550 [Verrucomicrobiota bacterium]|nr:hypothetical protein [Verrucomicrobiota bacterium]
MGKIFYSKLQRLHPRTSHPSSKAIWLAGVLLASPSVWGEVVLYETGFEAPGFIAGERLAGQQDWTAYMDENIQAATVTTEAARGGTQSAKVDGAAMNPYRERDYYDGFYYRAVPFDPISSGLPIIEFSVDALYVPNGGGIDARAQVELYDSNGASIGAFSVEAGGTVLGWGGDGMLLDTTCDIREWNTFGSLINYADRTIDFRLNGVSFGTAPLDPTVLDFYEADLTLVHNLEPSDQVVYYDNYRLSARAVPEPSCLALGLLGFGLLALKRGRVSRQLDVPIR